MGRVSEEETGQMVLETGAGGNASDAGHGAAHQPRFLGLDIGSRRIGVAVSDELGLTAQPVLTLYRKKPRDDVRSLARLARRYACTTVVAGYPLHMSGEPSAQAAKVQVLAEQLGQFSGLPIHFWDERLTSREAHQVLYEAGRPRQEHRSVVDQVAAVLILQGFLDARRQGEAAEQPAGRV